MPGFVCFPHMNAFGGIRVRAMVWMPRRRAVLMMRTGDFAAVGNHVV